MTKFLKSPIYTHTGKVAFIAKLLVLYNEEPRWSAERFQPPCTQFIKGSQRELLLPGTSAARAAVTAETRDLLPDSRYWKLTLHQFCCNSFTAKSKLRH